MRADPPREEGGLLDRVLALASVPELSGLEPDALASLATHTREQDLASGAQPPEADEPAVWFLLSGRLREERGGRVVEGPGIVGAIAALAGEPCPVRADGGPARALAIPRSELLWVLGDVFDAWSALLHHVGAGWLDAGGRAAPAALPASERRLDPDSLVDRMLLLRATGLFGIQRAHALGRIAGRMQTLDVPPGGLWDAGDPAHHALLLVEGTLGCAPRGSKGPATPLAPAAALIGLPEVLAERVRNARLEALSPCRLIRLDEEPLLDELEDDPDAATEFLTLLARRTLEARDAAGRDG